MNRGEIIVVEAIFIHLFARELGFWELESAASSHLVADWTYYHVAH